MKFSVCMLCDGKGDGWMFIQRLGKVSEFRKIQIAYEQAFPYVIPKYSPMYIPR